MSQFPFRWLVVGIAVGVAGTALALTPTEIMKAYKKPSSSQAIGLPLAEHPPVRCSEEAAGWMYFDVAM